MNDITDAVHAHLVEAAYDVGILSTPAGEITVFENDSVLGFVLFFEEPGELLANWRSASASVLQSAQFALRRAENKAWNTYLLFLAKNAGDYGQNINLGAIEEDLVGTRKIARAGLATPDDIRLALLPLLPVQNAPQLEAVEMAAEIRLRTTELPAELMDTFLAAGPDSTLLQLLEDGQ